MNTLIIPHGLPCLFYNIIYIKTYIIQAELMQTLKASLKCDFISANAVNKDQTMNVTIMIYDMMYNAHYAH